MFKYGDEVMVYDRQVGTFIALSPSRKSVAVVEVCGKIDCYLTDALSKVKYIPKAGDEFQVNGNDEVMKCNYSSKYVVIGEIDGAKKGEKMDVIFNLFNEHNYEFSKLDK